MAYFEDIVLQPRGFTFTAPAESSTTYDFVLDTNLYIKGAIFYVSGGQVGDWVESQVIDKDNVLGMGATAQNPIVLVEYVKRFYVFPEQVLRIDNPVVSDVLYQGLYLRTGYHNSGPAAANVAINLVSYIDK